MHINQYYILKYSNLILYKTHLNKYFLHKHFTKKFLVLFNPTKFKFLTFKILTRCIFELCKDMIYPLMPHLKISKYYCRSYFSVKLSLLNLLLLPKLYHSCNKSFLCNIKVLIRINSILFNDIGDIE